MYLDYLHQGPRHSTFLTHHMPHHMPHRRRPSHQRHLHLRRQLHRVLQPQQRPRQLQRSQAGVPGSGRRPGAFPDATGAGGRCPQGHVSCMCSGAAGCWLLAGQELPAPAGGMVCFCDCTVEQVGLRGLGARWTCVLGISDVAVCELLPYGMGYQVPWQGWRCPQHTLARRQHNTQC
jgi:hypothetical protein